MSRLFRLILAVGLLSLLLSQSFPAIAAPREDATPGTNLLASSGSALSFEVSLPAQSLRLEPVLVNGTAYTRVAFPDAAYQAAPGEPALPFLTKMLGAPFGARVSVSVRASQPVRVSLDAPVLPAPNQEQVWDLDAYLEDPAAIPPVIETILPDPALYASASPYPGELAKTLNDGIIRQQRVVSVGVFPVQYLPAENALLVYESLRVELRFAGAAVDSLPAARAESAVYEQFFSDNLLNYTQAAAMRRTAPTESPVYSAAVLNSASAKSWTPPNPGWRVTTRAEGFYRISASQLSAAGVPVESVDPDNYHMYHLGEEIAIQVSPEGEILFFAEALKSKYTADNVYWLTYNDTPGQRMQTRSAAPGSEPLVSSFQREEHHETDIFYRSKAPAEDDYEHYFWDYVYRKGATFHDWTYSLDLSRYVGGDIRLILPLIGYSQSSDQNPDHLVNVFLNGTQIYSASWDGFTSHLVDLTLPAGLLLPGANTLKVSSPNTAEVEGDLFWIDWLDLAYQRDFSVSGDKLKFSRSEPGDWKFELTNFSSADALVFDISDPSTPSELTGGTYSGTGPYALQFSDHISTASEYLAFTPDKILGINSITQDAPSNLQSTTQQADYLIISHANFLTAVQPLVGMRTAEGLEASLIDLQDVYDEFSYGIVDPAAVRAFIAFAYTHWQAPAPSYVLLVGDGNYDPKNYQNYGRTSFFPPYLAFVDPEIGETAADSRYVSIVGADPMPDLMLGRLSVNQPSEVTAYLAKLTSYETNPPSGNMLRSILAVTSKADNLGQFPLISEALLRDEYPGEPFSAQEVYWEWTHTDLPQARADIKNGFNEGRLLVNYIGHGGYNVWGTTGALLFRTSDINSLQNQDKYPFVLAMTCMEGFYTYPNPINSGYEAMAEMITRAAQKGAIASWSPTGWGSAIGHDLLNRGAFHAIYSSGVVELGAITQAGLARVWASGWNLDLLETYLLFGDPAVRLPRALTAVVDYYSGVEDTPLSVDAANGVLSNDIKPSGGTYSAVLAGNASFGSVVLNPDGSFIYTPNLDFCGEDSFSYKIFDGTAYSNTVRVKLNIEGVNDHPPVAYDQEVTTYINTPVTITLEYSDSDECGGSSSCAAGTAPEASLNFSYTFEIVTPPAHGTLSGAGPEVIYSPDPGYFGPDSFTFKVNDGMFDSNTAQVAINVKIPWIYLPILTR